MVFNKNPHSITEIQRINTSTSTTSIFLIVGLLIDIDSMVMDFGQSKCLCETLQ